MQDTISEAPEKGATTGNMQLHHNTFTDIKDIQVNVREHHPLPLCIVQMYFTETHMQHNWSALRLAKESVWLVAISSQFRRYIVIPERVEQRAYCI